MNYTFNIEKELELSGFSMRNITDAEAIFVAAYEKLYANDSGVSLSAMEKTSFVPLKSVAADKETLQEIFAFSVIFELFPYQMRLVVRKPNLSTGGRKTKKMYLIENDREMSLIDFDEIAARLSLNDLNKKHD
ncbi:hypothetical protein [Pedobacter sp. MR2016-24]|uniref:hypothetical protein n=1 Tax=Pedobacter sp. MR2016-24 TaxID=2994466 RepID=UPI0022461E2A|nr:hypothetical protein [Pedobacter sp. MR2016-24]MCX2482851.1 hypothetical protein [Pedobacter sp. MR2016-24]